MGRGRLEWRRAKERDKEGFSKRDEHWTWRMGEGLESKKEKDFRRWSKTNAGRKEEENSDFKGYGQERV